MMLRRLRALLANPTAYVVLLGLGAMAWAAMVAVARGRAEPGPPPLGPAPAFRLTDQLGRTVTDRDLRGKPYVADFFFTSCPSVCPYLTGRMAELGKTFQREGIGVTLVGFTIDPEVDTPQKLAEYGKRHGIDPARWRLLTGPDADVRRVVAGFGVHAERRLPGQVDIVHPTFFMLVDGAGRTRGAYASDETGLKDLAADVRRIAGR